MFYKRIMDNEYLYLDNRNILFMEHSTIDFLSLLNSCKNLQENPSYITYKKENKEQLLDLEKIGNSIERIMNLYEMQEYKNFESTYHMLLNIIYLYEDLINISIFENYQMISTDDLTKPFQVEKLQLEILVKDILILKTIEKEVIQQYDDLFIIVKKIIIEVITMENKQNVFNEFMTLEHLFNRFDYHPIDIALVDPLSSIEIQKIEKKICHNTIGFILTVIDNKNLINNHMLTFSITYYKNDKTNEDHFNIFFHRDNINDLLINGTNNFCLPSAYNIITKRSIQKMEKYLIELIQKKQYITEIISFLYLNFKDIKFFTKQNHVISDEMDINQKNEIGDITETATEFSDVIYIKAEDLKPFEEGISWVLHDHHDYFFTLKPETHTTIFGEHMNILKNYYDKIINRQDISDISLDFLNNLVKKLSIINTIYKFSDDKRYNFYGLNRGYRYIASPLFGSDLPIITEYDGNFCENDVVPQNLILFHDNQKEELLSCFFENHLNVFRSVKEAGEFIFLVRKYSPFSLANGDHGYRVIKIED